MIFSNIFCHSTLYNLQKNLYPDRFVKVKGFRAKDMEEAPEKELLAEEPLVKVLKRFASPIGFIIKNKATEQVLDAECPDSIAWKDPEEGCSSQVWKFHPQEVKGKYVITNHAHGDDELVLTLDKEDAEDDGFGRISMEPYRASINQIWSVHWDELVVDFHNLRLTLDPDEGAGCCPEDEEANQEVEWVKVDLEEWAELHYVKRKQGAAYYMIMNTSSQLVLDAEDPDQIVMKAPQEGLKTQIWKFHPQERKGQYYITNVEHGDDLPLDYHKDPDGVHSSIDHYFGKVYLHPFHGDYNQVFTVQWDQVLTEWNKYRIDSFEGCEEEGAHVGCYPEHGGLSQECEFGQKATTIAQWNVSRGFVSL